MPINGLMRKDGRLVLLRFHRLFLSGSFSPYCAFSDDGFRFVPIRLAGS